jgi:enolase
MIINNLIGYQVLDSRGRPTVAVTITLADGSVHTARVPSGASTGKHEAKELRDSDGSSVLKACGNVNEIIAPKLIGAEADLSHADEILKKLDPSQDHHVLGANATLAVSLAVTKAAAAAKGQSVARYFQPEGPLLIPMPMVNILSGGAHANRTMDIQDVLVLPNGATSFNQAITWITAIRENAAKRGAKIGPSHLIADEGGLGLAFESIDAACEFVTKSIEEVGLQVGSQVSLALDIASTQFFENGKYSLPTLGKEFTSSQFVAFMAKLVKDQPIISIEDPLAEDDWPAWAEFTSLVPDSLQILGDDLFTTNHERLDRGIAEGSANAILIKANQNGLVTDTHHVLRTAKATNFRTVVSARSGETEDSWLADLATGWRAEQIKVGSTHGADRTSKWNRLLELEAIEQTEFAKPF